MADGTQISWSNATWNVITGCSVISPGCTNCYAMREAGEGRVRNHQSRIGLTKQTNAGHVWTGEVRFNPYWLDMPLHWRRPRRVFVCAHGDMFHDAVPVEWLDLMLAVMAMSPAHQFQVLTKRAAGMRAYFESLPYRADDILKTIRANWTGLTEAQAVAVVQKLINGPLPNVWLGVSTEDQTRADQRIADLLAIPAAVHWASYEPALGPINFRRITCDLAGHEHLGYRLDALAGTIVRSDGGVVTQATGRLDWVVAGGESGRGARPCHPEWFRRTRDDCAATGVTFHFKQWGNWKHRQLPDGSAIDLGSLGKGKEPVINLPKGATIEPFLKGRMRQVIGYDGPGTMNSPVALMERVPTKGEAGHLLDGVEHLDFPMELAS